MRIISNNPLPIACILLHETMKACQQGWRFWLSPSLISLCPVAKTTGASSNKTPSTSGNHPIVVAIDLFFENLRNIPYKQLLGRYPTLHAGSFI